MEDNKIIISMELEAYMTMLVDIKKKILGKIKANKSMEDTKSKTKLTEIYDETHGNCYLSHKN